MAPLTSNNILPSSGAIHTTTTETKRTFYYSSLVIDHGSKTVQSRWKVHLGDVVVVAKKDLNQTALELIETWKPNHYTKKSLEWKVGLVIALRKVVSRHGVEDKNGVGGGTVFECHTQWLDKALDLDVAEMKVANLKSVYRPYNTNSKEMGSQLPHVLINCPRQYGIVSMIPVSESNEEYNVLLPVTIRMKTNRDFMKNGIKEKEESRYELQFCCTKTRRPLHKLKTSRGEKNVKSILSERDPDAWVELNCPSFNLTSENSIDDDATPVLQNKIPEPLQQAWKGWLRNESGIDISSDDNAVVSKLALDEKVTPEDTISSLGDALMRGWIQSRRERYNKAVLLREEQRRKVLGTGKTIESDPSIETEDVPKATRVVGAQRFIPEELKATATLIRSAPLDQLAGTSEAKSDAGNKNRSVANLEHGSNKRKRKELRFSADTKQPPSKRISKIMLANPSRRNVSSWQQQAKTSGVMDGRTKDSVEFGETNRQLNRTVNKNAGNQGINEDDLASTTTRDTHSTDTTLPTRGAGRGRNKHKLRTKIFSTNDDDVADDNNCDENETMISSNTTKLQSMKRTWKIDKPTSPLNVLDTFNEWQLNTSFIQDAVPFYQTKHRDFFRELQIMIPFAVVCSLLDDEGGIVNDIHSNDNANLPFVIKIGSVVAIHYKESISTTSSWSPFRLPWGVAQITNIFRERNNKTDEWRLTIRWFYRLPELQAERWTQTLKSMNKTYGVLETYESCDCSVKELLPAFIQLTSDSDIFSTRPKKVKGENDFPIVRMLCQHLEHSHGKITRNLDWNYDHATCLERSQTDLKDVLPGPIKRAIQKMPRQLKRKYTEWLTKSSKTTKARSLHKTSTTNAFFFDIVPESIGVFCNELGNKYVDAVCLNVRKKDLRQRLHSKCCCRWTLAVGHIIAVHCKNAKLSEVKSDAWYPFEKKWCPGQVVSLYQKECESWMMEVRWFDRYDEILQTHKSSLNALNKDYVLFETEAYEHLPISDALPGRIILTSVDESENWDVTMSDVTGLPLIPRLCTHICFDEEIGTSTDWTNYDLTLPQIPPGLSRGLLLRPTNRQGKELVPKLSQFYTRALRMRGSDPDHHHLCRWSEERNVMGERKWTDISFKSEEITVELGEHFLTINPEKGSQDFYRSISVSSPIAYLVSPTMEMKRRRKTLFEFMPGDIVCYFDSNASVPETYASAQHIKFPWYPFRIPFSYGQILSIRKESIVGDKDSIKIEIRRFYKLSELSNDAKQFLPLHIEGTHEQIFESNDIELGIAANFLLGTVNVILGNQVFSGSTGEKNIICCRCNFFYLKTFQRLQPIYWSALSPARWKQGLRERGCRQSSFLHECNRLGDELPNAKYQLPNIGPTCDALPSAKNSQKEGSCVGLKNQTSSSSANISFYEEALLCPHWSLFHATNYLPLADCSERKVWKLKIGDVVAVHDSETPQSSASFYPFTVPWFPAQILAIYTESKAGGHEIARFEIRCLKFEVSIENDDHNEKRKIAEHHPTKTMTVASTDLLGPLTLYSPDAICATDLTKIHIHLPLSEFLAAKSLKFDRETASSLSKLNRRDKPRTDTEAKDENSHVCEDSSLIPVFNDVERNSDEHRCSNKAFRVDALHFRAFYTKMTLVPNFRVCLRGNIYQQNFTSRTIKIGDTIQVRFEGSKRYPYDCNWGVAEVVAIFKEFSSHDEFHREHLLTPKEQRNKQFQIEIRWFYERSDLSLVALSADDSSEFIEVYETDHCQIVDASHAILDHVKLVEDTIGIKRGDVKHFVCTRFWSTKRRSLIPCSGLNGRIKRGLIHSTLGLEEDLEKSDSTELKRSLTNWKDSMVNLIWKLTLKDASKNAYKGRETLVGREKELSQLLAFLRAALLEDHKSKGYKSSMFLAGPPGVGKTATVRAAISMLHHELKGGNIPTFRFIPLNGIEVRHPSDIYIRFWEALTERTHLGPHERACERLEAFFTSTTSESDLPNNCTTIVLLDEIDYLVTDDQSILYNLFDWPKRAAELSSTSRLIVIGISNTLNLIDHLMASVQSRMGTEKCVFKAYSLDDTISILRSKMKEGSPNFMFFEDDAILFAAKKTAALSGDIRKAFQICRSAAELVTRRFEEKKAIDSNGTDDFPKIRISDVQKASLESFNMAMVTAVSFSSPFETLLLVSLASLSRSSGHEVGGFDVNDILIKMEALASASGNPQYIPAPSFGETIRLLHRLGEMNLVELNTRKSSSRTFRQSHGGSGGAWPLTSLAIDELTLLKGLKNTSHKDLAKKHLPSMF